MHHKLLDLGAYTIHDDYRVVVSERVHGGRGFDEILLSHHGQKLRSPQRKAHRPEKTNLAWHRKEVFKPDERELNRPSVERSQ
jgi:putative restriction endonuclease